MATYVPGSETYLPDIKPFTPDYKFLSAVLDVRQDKYNTNWQATNNVYNKVVFADMSRKDTNEQREQYVNNLAPSLEKISGMDLSLAQNAQSAKAVFAPFFEDKLIVKDMVKTANYRKEMSHAERLLASPDPNVNGQYWRDGKAALQYRMEDFINMDADAAINTPLYKYVPNVNLFKLSEEILGGLEPPLSITYDVESPTGEWIITKKNGEAVVGPALQILRNRLATDGRVIQAYQTKAYVAGRDFAAAGMQAGDFNSVEEGQNAWAQATISNIEFNNEQRLKEGALNLENQRAVNVRWSNYKKQYGIVPGSREDEMMNDQLTAYEATKLELENQMEVKRTIDTPSNNLETTLNRAYQLLMMTNMNSDMIKAAEAFSMRDMESTIRESKFEIQKRKFANDKALLQMKFNNDAKIKAAEKAEEENSLSNAVSGTWLTIGDAATNEVKRDPVTNEIDPNANVYQNNVRDFLKDDRVLNQDKINIIMNALPLIYGSGNNVVPFAPNKGKNIYSFKTDQGLFSGNLAEIRTYLEKTNKNGAYINKKPIDVFFKEILNITHEQTKNDKGLKLAETNPGLVETPAFGAIYLGIDEINQNENLIDLNIKSALKNAKENYALAETIVRKSNSDIDKKLKEGWGGLYKDDSLIQLTKEEYIDRAIEFIKNDKENLYYKYLNEVDVIVSSTPRITKTMDGDYPDITKYVKKTVLDIPTITQEAKVMYNKLYEAHNKQMIEGTQTGSYTSIKSGRVGDFEDVYAGVTYNSNFDAMLSPESDGAKAYINLMNQKNAISGVGETMNVFFGTNTKNASIADPAIINGFLEIFTSDVNSYSGSKTSNALDPRPRAVISYSPTMGPTNEKGEKNTAGYFIKFNGDYVDSKLSLTGLNDTQKAAVLDRRQRLKDGVSIIYDQNLDQNPLATTTNYGNKYIANVMASEDGRWTDPVNIGINNVGTYSISQGSKDSEFILNTTFRRFVDNEWITDQPIPEIINIKYNDYKILDDAVENSKSTLEQYGIQSNAAYEQWVELNGIR